MSVGYGMMMFANQHRAALHDGEKWIDLYGAQQQQEMEELMATEVLLMHSSELLDETMEMLDTIEKKTPKQ